jgi:flavin-binding protein dodecin
MAESVYKVIELVGTSPTSWEKAAAAAVKLASTSLRDLRIAEVSQLDMHLEEGKILAYRARVKVSFKYTPGGDNGPSKSAPAKDSPAKAKKAAAPAAAPVAAPVAPKAAKKAAKKKGKRKKK